MRLVEPVSNPGVRVAALPRSDDARHGGGRPAHPLSGRVTEQTGAAAEFVGQQTPRAALREEAAALRASTDPITLQMDAADLAACHTVEDFLDLIDRRVRSL